MSPTWESGGRGSPMQGERYRLPSGLPGLANSSPLHPWDLWIPQDLHIIFWWVADVIALLSEIWSSPAGSSFSGDQVHSAGSQSTAFLWLRPDFRPPHTFFVCARLVTADVSGVVIVPALIKAQSRQAHVLFLEGGRRPTLS